MLWCFYFSGSFIYQWYSADGTKLTDGVNISGSGTTTLTVSNITSPDDDGKSFYLESAFSSGTYDTTTGRGVGNCIEWSSQDFNCCP